MRDLLTQEDREWLNGLSLNLTTWRELTCAQLKGVPWHDQKRIALDGVVYRHGSWVNARDIVEEVGKSLTWNTQIFEAWDYGYASGIHEICDTLTSFDADILLIASGYKDQDLSELSRASTEAVAEAYRDLYGEGEDDDEDDTYHYYASGGGAHDMEGFVDPVVEIDDENEVR